MTEIVFAVIDNHKLKKGTSYKIIYHTHNINQFNRFVREKGLIKE